MSENKRLHPISIAFNVLNWLKSAFFLIIIFFITMEFIYFLIGLVIFILILTTFAFLLWYRFSYRVEEEALVIESGVIRRTKRTISKHRLQSIDLTQSVIHRLFKLVRVKIETATTGTAAEADFSAIQLAEGYALREQLKQIGNEQEKETENEAEIYPKRIATQGELFIFGVTSGGVGIIVGSLLVIFSEFAEYIPSQIYDTTWEWIVASSILVIIVLFALLLILIWFVSVGVTFIRYGKFTITRENNELFITRGLLEKKQLTIPLSRIQAVGIDESLFRQPFGYVSVFAEVAGGSVNEKESTSVVLLPIMKRKEVQIFLETFTPGMSWDTDVQWTRPPRTAKKFYFFRTGIIPLIILAAVLYFYPLWTWVALLLFPIAFYLAWLRYKDTGFSVHENNLLIRYRILKRVTVLLPKRRIQVFQAKQHVLQRRDQLGTLELSILNQMGGKHYILKDLLLKDLIKLSDWYLIRNQKGKVDHENENR